MITSLPKGWNNNGIDLKITIADGIPTIVKHNAAPSITAISTCQIPAKIIQKKLNAYRLYACIYSIFFFNNANHYSLFPFFASINFKDSSYVFILAFKALTLAEDNVTKIQAGAITIEQTIQLIGFGIKLNAIIIAITTIPQIMLMYGKEASNRKQ